VAILIAIVATASFHPALVLVYVHWVEVSGAWVDSRGGCSSGEMVLVQPNQLFQLGIPLWKQSRLHTTAFQLSMSDGREVWE